MNNTDYKKLQTLIYDVLNKNMPVEFIHGYLTAVVCAPNMVMPSAWMPMIFNDENNEEPEYNSMDEANSVMMPIMNMQNEIADSLMDKSYKPLFTIKKEKVTPDIASVWCEGFVSGAFHWGENFIEDDALKKFIIPIMCLAKGEDLMDILIRNSDEDFKNKSEDQIKLQLLDIIPKIPIALRHHVMSGENNSHMFNADNQVYNAGNVGKKIGRNEPCPCGSGKKYKKCCG